MVADTYSPERDISDRFLQIVATWIRESGEVLVILRYLRAAGAKDYGFVRTEDEFHGLIDILPVGTDIIVFRNQQLPLRGAVTDDFIASAKSLINDGDEYLYVKMQPLMDDDIRAFGEMGDTHNCMDEDLREHMGEEVAIGHCPPFIDPDNEAMISASKGGIDGPR
jgi:hypothetical protein